MKKEFIGYYNPSDKEISDAWNKGTFAFDANTLLNLYRYSENTRKDFLSALKAIKQKLFLPHQAALEFHSNRIGVIEGIGHSYDNLYKIFENNFEKNLEPQINQFKKHPVISIDQINKLHSEFLKKISSELEKQRKNHPDFKTKDEVLDQLTELFESATGKEFTKEELIKIYTEGKERYAEGIPPGYKDLENKKKKGDRHVYGDLIIWKELIAYAKKEKKSLLLITDDRKEDWWNIENGKTIRPREELIKEFFDLTGIRILIYNADNFLYYAKEKKLVPKLKDETIKEVKEIRLSDENLNKFITSNIGRTTGLTVQDYINSGGIVSPIYQTGAGIASKLYKDYGVSTFYIHDPNKIGIYNPDTYGFVDNKSVTFHTGAVPYTGSFLNTEPITKKEVEDKKNKDDNDLGKD
ncbi:MAG: PIN-like domain-containing protein [Sphingobacteriaceae bacterium]